MTMTPPDIAICIILGFFTFNGFRHGFIEEVGRLISLVGGFILASKFHPLLLPFLLPYIESETLQVTIAYLIVFMVTIIIISIIVKMLHKFIEFTVPVGYSEQVGDKMYVSQETQDILHCT